MTPASTTDRGREPVLTGERVLLRPFGAGDLTKRYLDWLNDPEVTRYLEVGKTPVTLSRAGAFLDRIAQSESGLFLIILDRISQQAIGTVTLNDIDAIAGTANTGLMIGEKSFWGKGYASETWGLLLAYAFGTLGLRHVHAGAVTENAPSIQVLTKLGFVEEGTEMRTVVGKTWRTLLFGLDASRFRHREVQQAEKLRSPVGRIDDVDEQA